MVSTKRELESQEDHSYFMLAKIKPMPASSDAFFPAANAHGDVGRFSHTSRTGLGTVRTGACGLLLRSVGAKGFQLWYCNFRRSEKAVKT